MSEALTISNGFTDAERPVVAQLYWSAFGAKLGKVMGAGRRATAFFRIVADPNFALAARAPDCRLLGIAGFKTPDGGLVGGSLTELAQVYGWVGALWRGLLLSTLERKLQPDVFQMDGIFVDPDARGQGVGTALLQAVLSEAEARGLRQVQLDVIDTNPRAKALYERVGFVATGTENTGPLKLLFGFSSATRMAFETHVNAPTNGDA